VFERERVSNRPDSFSLSERKSQQREKESAERERVSRERKSQQRENESAERERVSNRPVAWLRYGSACSTYLKLETGLV
jgi:hypothetical protein